MSQSSTGCRTMPFEERFPWELAQILAEVPFHYLPLGALQWRGEHSAVGRDAIKTHALCVAAARPSRGVVMPPLHWATYYIGVVTAVGEGADDSEPTASADRGRLLFETIARRRGRRARDEG